MPSGTRLQDLKGRTLTVSCEPCRRGGAYQVADLCRRLGPEMALSDALLTITRRCRRQRAVGSREPNEYGAHCRARLELEPADARSDTSHLGIAGTWMRTPSYPPYRIDVWTATGSIQREIALVLDLKVAHAALQAAGRLYPEERLTLRQGARVIGKAGVGGDED